jgi:hypothetical protein
MAKKKPAVKMTVKKPVAKIPGKKPVAKAPLKKASKMAKKVAAKKTVPVKKITSKKSEKKPPQKSLRETIVKAASKLLKKPLTKQQEKKTKEKEKALAKKEKERLAKEAAKKKALAAKEKEKSAKEKAKQKELEKKQKEQEKIKAKAEKEAEKLRIKAEKEAAKKKSLKGKKGSNADEDFDDDEDIELGPDDEPAFGEERKSKKAEDDDFDEFEEDYKKSKATKKSGKKAYEEDSDVEIFPAKQGKKYSNSVLAELQSTIADEIAQLREHFNWKEIAEAIGSMDFFIDAKNDECIEKGCDNIRTTQSYCRLHYLRNWKTIQKKREILKEGKLQEYIEELISKYPPKFIEALLSDLSDDKEFYRVLNELNITSEFDFEEDEFENAVDDDDADDDIGIETISSSLRYEDE